MAAPRLRSLPRNVTDVTRALVCVDGTVQNLQLSPDVGSVPLERVTPIREFFSWPGKRNYEGLYWSSTNRSHVDFESLLEREYLMVADNALDVVSIAAQPLALLWPRDTSGNRDHVPDFFVRLANGDGRLIDVRSPKGAEKHTEENSINRSRPSIMTTSSQGAIDDRYAPALSGIPRWFASQANRSSYQSDGPA